MAKKEFGDALRRNTKKKKLPVDLSAVENVEAKGKLSKSEVSNSPTPPPKPQVIRTSFNLPGEVHEAMLQYCFQRRISMKDYLVNLVKKDLNLD